MTKHLPLKVSRVIRDDVFTARSLQRSSRTAAITLNAIVQYVKRAYIAWMRDLKAQYSRNQICYRTMRRVPRLLYSGARVPRLEPGHIPAIVTVTRGAQALCPEAGVRAFSFFPERRNGESSSSAKAPHDKNPNPERTTYGSHVEDEIGQLKKNQLKTPWHREGSDKPPVRRLRSASAMTKGSFVRSLKLPSALLMISDRQVTHDTIEAAKIDPASHKTR